MEKNPGKGRGSVIPRHMSSLAEKLPFVVELFFSGNFILLYTLHKADKLPSFIGGELLETLLIFFVWIMPLVILLSLVSHYMLSLGVSDFLRKYFFSVITFFSMLLTWGDPEFVYWLGGAHLISSIYGLYNPQNSRKKGSMGRAFLAPLKNNSFFEYLHLKPTQLVLILFLAVILLGSIFLVLPYSTKGGGLYGVAKCFFPLH